MSKQKSAHYTTKYCMQCYEEFRSFDSEKQKTCSLECGYLMRDTSNFGKDKLGMKKERSCDYEEGLVTFEE